jgi:hypothetical protein
VQSTSLAARTPPGDRRLAVLLVCDDRRTHAGNVREHIAAFRRYSRHRIDLFNPRGIEQPAKIDLAGYDAIVIHYTILVTSDYYLPPWLRTQIAAFRGLKVQFLQDEYRWVDAITAESRNLGIQLLYSLVPQEVLGSVYGNRLPGVEILTTLAGFVPYDVLRRPVVPFTSRSLDVVYRGRGVPFWLGTLGQDKAFIGREFLERAQGTDLQCDIAWNEIDRIYGKAWYRFLESGRTTLGTESGASIVDFSGELQERTDEYLTARPTASFEEVAREILAPYEGNAVIRVVSPRVFEAAALRTGMVNFTGGYSGTIEPWHHYVPLERDFSNFDEVVSVIRDDAALRRLTDTAYADLIASGRYSLQRFIREFDETLTDRRPKVALSGTRPRPTRRPRSRGLRERYPATLMRGVFSRLLERKLRRSTSAIIDARQVGRHCLPSQLHSRLDQDLIRLAAATGAHSRTLRAAPGFHVELELDPSGNLSMISRTHDDLRGRDNQSLRGEIELVLRSRRTSEIVWSHRGVGYAVSVPVAGRRMALEVGYHTVYGAYAFHALTALSKSRPDVVLTALQPLFDKLPELGSDEDIATRPVETSTISRLRGAPLQVAARAYIGSYVLLTSRPLRRLWLVYLRDASLRATVPPDVVFMDLLRLRLIREAGRLTDRTVTVSIDRESDLLTFTTTSRRSVETVPEPALTIATDAPAGLVWDNSAFGSRVQLSRRPNLMVSLGSEGVYEFSGLSRVIRGHPTAGMNALLYALPPR